MKTRFVGAVLAGAALFALSACAISIGGSETQIDQSPGSCQAAKHQTLLGMDAASINRETLPKAFRIVCFQCPMTMDYREDRLTIQLDKNNKVESARCG